MRSAPQNGFAKLNSRINRGIPAGRGWRRRDSSRRCWLASTAITPRLHRQAQIFARHGVEIDRSTLANWVGGACWWLEPLHARLAANVFASANIFADDTPIPVLDPGRGGTKTGRLWVYVRDDRLGRGRARPRPSTSTAQTARLSDRPPISAASAGSCRSTGMRASSA